MDPDDDVMMSLQIATCGWIPPQVKAVFAERDGHDVIVHLGYDIWDERIQDADEDIGTAVDNEIPRWFNFRGLHTHESPDVATWRARGWLPIHLSADWGRDWVEPCDELAVPEPAPEWTPRPEELWRPENRELKLNVPAYIGHRLHATLGYAIAGQVTPLVRDVNAVVSATGFDIYWHLDAAPDQRTTHAMNVTAVRLRKRSVEDFTQRWHTHDYRMDPLHWGLIYGRDDPRTWDQRVAEDD